MEARVPYNCILGEPRNEQRLVEEGGLVCGEIWHRLVRVVDDEDEAGRVAPQAWQSLREKLADTVPIDVYDGPALRVGPYPFRDVLGAAAVLTKRNVGQRVKRFAGNDRNRRATTFVAVYSWNIQECSVSRLKRRDISEGGHEGH